MDTRWVTVSQACDIYKVTRRTLTRWIQQGKVESKLEDKRRYILATDVGHSATQEGHDDSDMSQDMPKKKLVDQLQSEVEYLRSELKETKERSDTIILQLTRQNQLLLENKSGPWYRRVFRKTRNQESE